MLDRIKAMDNSLVVKYGNIKRQMFNYYELGGVDGVIEALRKRNKPINLDNAKIKLV